MMIRVLEGGHSIPEDIIIRRYTNGIKNLFDIYLGAVDEVMIFDNSDENPEFIAEKNINSDITIHNIAKFDKLKGLL